MEEAEARGWLDKEFNDWIQSMMEQASVIGSFEASNLEGEPITEEIFADYDLTMVNLWTTTCGYCIEEMPTLEKLRAEFPGGRELVQHCWHVPGHQQHRRGG